MKFAKSKWDSIDEDNKHEVLPLAIPYQTGRDAHDEIIRQAIQWQNNNLRFQYNESGIWSFFEEASFCITERNNKRYLTMQLRGQNGQNSGSGMMIDGSAYTFAGPISRGDYLFPEIASNGEPADCKLSTDRAQILYFNGGYDIQYIVRIQKSSLGCALDLFWIRRNDTIGKHVGFEIAQSLCATASENEPTKDFLFRGELTILIHKISQCLAKDTLEHVCLQHPLIVGGGLSKDNRVVIAQADQNNANILMAFKQKGRESQGFLYLDTNMFTLRGEPERMRRLVTREWKRIEVDTFANWLRNNPKRLNDLRLIYSNDQELYFANTSGTRDRSGVLRINFGVTQGTPGAKTEIDLISARGDLNDEVVGSILDRSKGILANQDRIEIALISKENDELIYAVKQESSSAEKTRWKLYKNNASLGAVLLGDLTPSELVPGLGKVLDKLVSPKPARGEIQLARNRDTVLAANEGDAWVADYDGKCVQQLIKADADKVKASDRKQIIDLWLKDFEYAPLKVGQFACSGAAFDVSPRLETFNGNTFKIVDYNPGVLNHKKASHVLVTGDRSIGDRSITVIRKTDFLKLSDAENQAAAYAISQPDPPAPRRLELLGQIGIDKLRFTFNKRSGIAGRNFACLFSDSLNLSKQSVVLDEYLASIKQCEDGNQVDLGASVQMDSFQTSNGVVDVVAAPEPSKSGPSKNDVWSLYFGDGKGNPNLVQSVQVTFNFKLQPTDKNEDRFKDLVALVRAWTKAGTEIGFTRREVSVTKYGEVKPVAVAAADDNAFVFVTALRGGAAGHFWPLGGSNQTDDPFKNLNPILFEAAATLLTLDLERLASLGQVTKPESSFCVIQTPGDVTLWPNLVDVRRPVEGGQPFEVHYRALGTSSASDLLAVVDSSAQNCKSLQSRLSGAYRKDLKVVLLVPRDRSVEVWLGSSALGGAHQYNLIGNPLCSVHAQSVAGTRVFEALSRRPRELNCPENVFTGTGIYTGTKSTPPLILADRERGGVTTAWVETETPDGFKGFKGIGLIGPARDYFALDWKLLKEGDLSTNSSHMSLALVLKKDEGADTLILMSPNGKIVARSLNCKEKPDNVCEDTVQTLGFPTEVKDNCAIQPAPDSPANGENCAVLVGLKTWAKQEAKPEGLVLHRGQKPRFWMLDPGKSSARLFELAPWRHYTVLFDEATAQLEANALMRGLSEIGESLLSTIKEGASRLRIDEKELAVIGAKRLILETRKSTGGGHVRITNYGQKPDDRTMNQAIAALTNDSNRCVAEDPCDLLHYQTFFALVSREAVTFGNSDNGRFGQGSIKGANGAKAAALITRMLKEVNISLVDPSSRVIVPINKEGQGLVIDQDTKLRDQDTKFARFFGEGTVDRKFKLRPTLWTEKFDDLAKRFSNREWTTFVETLIKIGEPVALGLSKSESKDKNLFACSAHSISILDGSSVASITGEEEEIRAFCDAIEKWPFNPSGRDGISSDRSSIVKQQEKEIYLLSKSTSSGHKLRVWGESYPDRKSIELPFDPNNTPRAPLENSILNSAIDCKYVERIVREREGLGVIGESPVKWECSIVLENAPEKKLPIDRPMLFVTRPQSGNALIFAGAELPEETKTVAARSSEILAEIAGLAARKDVSGHSIKVKSRRDWRGSEFPFILEAMAAEPKGSSEEQGAIIAWLPLLEGPVQTIQGRVREIDELWNALGTQFASLSGEKLRLIAFDKNEGAVVSDDSESNITVAPASGPSITRDANSVTHEIRMTCSKQAMGGQCRNITPSDMAKAALKASKDRVGGRRIFYGDDRRFIVWPENALTFWENIKANGDRQTGQRAK